LFSIHESDFRSLRSQKANRESCNRRRKKGVKVDSNDTPPGGSV
jgi:hypothetical protein